MALGIGHQLGQIRKIADLLGSSSQWSSRAQAAGQHDLDLLLRRPSPALLPLLVSSWSSGVADRLAGFVDEIQTRYPRAMPLSGLSGLGYDAAHLVA